MQRRNPRRHIGESFCRLMAKSTTRHILAMAAADWEGIPTFPSPPNAALRSLGSPSIHDNINSTYKSHKTFLQAVWLYQVPEINPPIFFLANYKKYSKSTRRMHSTSISKKWFVQIYVKLLRYYLKQKTQVTFSNVLYSVVI